jgi:hypothetical protein
LPWDEYSPFDPGREAEIEGYPAHVFVGSRSPEETQRIKREFDEYQGYNEVLQDSGAYGVMNMVASGVFNPAALIPLYGFTNHASRATMGMLKASGTAAAAEATNELLLHGVDRTRTIDESAINTVGAAAFAGLMGGLVARKSDFIDELFDSEQAFLRENRELNSVLQMDPDYHIVEQQPGIFRIEPKPIKLSEEAPVDQIKGKFLRLMARVTPIRALSSANPLTRVAAANLGEQMVVGSSRHAVETFIHHRDSMLGEGLKHARKNWRAFNARPENPHMSYADFQKQVARALRNNDSSNIPEVQASTRMYRKVLDDVKSQAIEVGLLKEADTLTKFADTYFPRVFNLGRIKGMTNEFIDEITTYLRTAEKMDPEEAENLAFEIHTSITGNNFQPDFHKNFVPKTGSLKGRKLAIPDNVLEDWLINEPESIIRQYTRNVGAQVEVQKRFGSLDLKDHLKDIDDEWARILKKAHEQGISDRQQRIMQRQRKKDQVDIMAMRDRLLNRYKMPDDPSSGWVRMGRAGRNLAVLSKLGGMTLSAFPDVARPIYKHGLRRYTRAIMAVVTNPALRRMNSADMRRMGVGMDMVMNQRLRSLADLDYNPHGVSKGEQLLEAATQGTGYGGKVPDFGKVSLMSYWNTSLKDLSGLLSQDGLLGMAAMPHKFAKKLSLGSIDAKMARRITEQFKKHGQTDNGMRIANSDLWDDPKAQMAFEMAVRKEVDGTIVTPGMLDRPLWMSSEHGKVIGAMRSFAFASTNKQLLAGLNNMDSRVVQGVLASTMFGAVSLTVKGLLAGKTMEEITGDNPAEFMWNSVAHSGAIGIGSELSDIAMSAVGKDNNTYLFEKKWESALLGPVVGDITGVIPRGIMGDPSAVRRMIPYNNLFYIRKLFDKMEEELE